MCLCVCVCRRWFFCVYVWRVVRCFFFCWGGGGVEGERLKFDRDVLYINEFEVENLCQSV